MEPAPQNHFGPTDAAKGHGSHGKHDGSCGEHEYHKTGYPSIALCFWHRQDKTPEKKIRQDKKSITILHCTSEYHAPYEEVNLKAMNKIKKIFKLEVGYSDHTNDILTPALAVITGAQIIEKHFTYNKKQKVQLFTKIFP